MKLFAEGLSSPGFTMSKTLRIRHKDGSWKIHEATGHNLLEDTAVAGIVVNSRDITNRKRLEQRLTAQFQVGRILAEAERVHAAETMLLRATCEILGWGVGQYWIRCGE